MYGDAARFYDVIHDARGRDADAEAELVLREVLQRLPTATTLLDVGCGTGVHLPRFAESFEVVGVDSSPQMLDIARGRAPDVLLVEGDFRTFDVGRRFDSCVSLFSGSGYLIDEVDLRLAVSNKARHLNPGGVLLVEGWVEPEYWLGSMVSAESGVRGDLAVARAARSRREGVLCEVEMRYVAATDQSFETVDERHVLRLSDPDEVAGAFIVADVTFERLPHLLHPGRSVYVGVRR